MQKKTRTMLAVAAPLVLGLATALIFLAFYLNRNSVILTIRNRTGMDILGGGIRLSSQPKEEELGPVPDNDSARIIFRDVGDGEYVLNGKLKNGTEFRISEGHVTHGADRKDELVLEMKGDSVTGTLKQPSPGH